jgi:hypothetical protein
MGITEDELSLSVAEDVSQRILGLLFYNSLTVDEQACDRRGQRIISMHLAPDLRAAAYTD